MEKICSYCGGTVDSNGYEARSMIDLPQTKVLKVIQKVEQGKCSKCGGSFAARRRGVFPKSLYGNGLLGQTAVWHYLYGIPLGRISKIVKVDMDHLIGPFQRLAGVLESSVQRLIKLYRLSPLKHADETTWRTDGRSGYAWIFSNEAVTIFRFCDTRSAIVPREIFGEKELPGILVIDRYSGYNQAPCKIQYCYEHLKRNVQDLGKEFPDNEEVQDFVEKFSLLLIKAIKLWNRPISDKAFYRLAKELKNEIIEVVEAPSQHVGIQRMQDIFYENSHRMYHWAEDRGIPADNNFVERELRTTVIARKVSFGSQSEQGAKTREVLMTILHTLNKHVDDVATHFKEALDRLAFDSSLDPYDVLFGQISFFSDSREKPLSIKVMDGFPLESRTLTNENKIESSPEESKLSPNQRYYNPIYHKKKEHEKNMCSQAPSHKETISQIQRAPPPQKISLRSQIIMSFKNIVGLNLVRWFSY